MLSIFCYVRVFLLSSTNYSNREGQPLENVMVTIHCITYNHENFIADAIDSFLKQQTNFNFEIIIHDDASTDRTADIIREYQKQYPNLIKPIYQIENKYSKGESVGDFIIQRAKGKYIALCEGDDYWIDPFKLQKQVDYMEENPQCSLCVHAGHVVSASEKNLMWNSRPNKGSKFFTVDEVIEGGGDLFLTNSMLYPTKLAKDKPDFFEKVSVGDYPLTINLSLLGSVYYMDEFMSAYRVGHSGSWTATNFSKIDKMTKHFREIEQMLDEINQYTNFQYEEAIIRRKCRDQFFLLLKEGKFKEMKKKEYKHFYLELGFKRRNIIFMDQYLPNVSDLLRGVKRKLVR